MPWDYSSPRTVRPGDRVRIELPYSEVCMHMRVAGRVMDVRMTDGRYPMAQLLNSDGSEFSFPITTGEAGIYGDYVALAIMLRSLVAAGRRRWRTGEARRHDHSPCRNERTLSVGRYRPVRTFAGAIRMRARSLSVMSA
jgi:hypothetical protein